MAAHCYFPDEPDMEFVECDTFEQLFSAMQADQQLIALVAIENTIAGSLLHNYELLRDSGLQIVGEHKLRIRHNLMCLPTDTIDDIREIRSHPVALMQCRRYLNQYPHIKVVEADDTANAARLISQNQLHGIAAIASAAAADIYGMKILDESIETNKHNFTRFMVLAHPGQASQFTAHSQPDKASIVFSLEHSEGSLSQVLSIFSFYHINLTKIQSLPIIGHEWEYLFYVDMMYADHTRFLQSIDAVRPLTSQLQLLGEYRDGQSTI